MTIVVAKRWIDTHLDNFQKLKYYIVMDDIRISLSDSSKAYVDAEVADGSYGSVSECIDALVLAGAKAKAQEKLEALLLEGLDGEETEWTADDAKALMRLAITGR